MPKKSSLKPRVRLIRLVVQLNDTRHNRAVLDELQFAAQSSAVQSPYASIKREDVTIVALLTTKPCVPDKEEEA